MVASYGQILRAPMALASGTPCTVTRGDDAGNPGDLRSCMIQVQADPGGGTITFDSGITTVTLTSSLPNIVQDTTITGGSRNVTITAAGIGFRFVGVDPTVNFTANYMSLDHLTVDGFDSRSATPANRQGAVVYVAGSSGGTITISDCVISNNAGNGVIFANGGANPTLSIERTTIEDNTSTGYGTVNFVSANALTVTSSTFRGNSANYSGGAIYDVGVHTTTITGSTFTDNSAIGDGGAVFEFFPTLTITDSTFSGNSANHGGAIYHNQDATITRSSFYNNSARFTGAIAARNVTLVNSFVGHNLSTNTASATRDTGGVYAAGNADLQFSTVYANSVAADHNDPPGFTTMSQMNVQGHLTSTASIIAADAGSGGDGPVGSSTHQWSSTVLTGASAYPSPYPMSGSDDGFRVGPGQVGLASLAPTPSASPGWLGQPPLPTSVVYTAAPTADPLPWITTDQVGYARPNRASGGNAWTIGSRQLAAGAAPSPSGSPTSSPSSSATPTPSPGGGGGGANPSPTPTPTATPTASASSSAFVPVPQPVGSSLAPGGSGLLVNGQPAPGLVVSPNGVRDGVDARGPGFALTMQGQTSGGRPVALTPSGALQVDPGGRVGSRGTGFRSGSQVGMFVDSSDQAARSRMLRRAALAAEASGTPLGTLPVNASGAFDGSLALPAGLAVGPHVLQVVGQAPDGSTRAVSLGIEVVQRSGVVTITATRGGLLGSVVTVTGRVTGIDATTVVPTVWSGSPAKATAVKARPVVAADGTFTWRLRTRSAVIVSVTAGGVRSNRLVVPAGRAHAGTTTAPVTKKGSTP